MTDDEINHPAEWTELARLRKINHELVCAHNDLLVAVTHLEALQISDADRAVLEAADAWATNCYEADGVSYQVGHDTENRLYAAIQARLKGTP